MNDNLKTEYEKIDTMDEESLKKYINDLGDGFYGPDTNLNTTVAKTLYLNRAKNRLEEMIKGKNRALMGL